MSTILVFDTETTKVVDPKICEIAVILETNGIKSIQELINPEEPISIGSMAIHNITDDMVKGAPKFTESNTYNLMTMFNEESSIFVGHNVGFDVIAFENSSNSKVNAKIIDTYKVAYEFFDEDLESYKLNYLRYYMGVNSKCIDMIEKLDPSNSKATHSALFDTVICYQIFQFMLSKFTIDEMVEISRRPIIFKKLSIGKYKGKSFEEVAITDYQYLEWMFNNEMKKCVDKGMTRDEMKNNQILATLLFYLDKYKVKTDD